MNSEEEDDPMTLYRQPVKSKEQRRSKQKRIQEHGQLTSKSKFVSVDNDRPFSDVDLPKKANETGNQPFQYVAQSINVVIGPPKSPVKDVQSGLRNSVEILAETSAFDPKQNQEDQNLIAQYEQVMQLMHLEMTKLIEQNKQLKESRSEDQASAQMQFDLRNILREREDLVENLAGRDQTINQLRLENQQLMSRIMDQEARSDAQRAFSVETNTIQHAEANSLRTKNAFLEDRVRQMDEQVRTYEQRLYQTEKALKGMERDARNLTQTCEQLKGEVTRANQKREASEQLVLELKQKLCEVYIDMRTYQNQIDTQTIAITKLANAKQNTERLLEQANQEVEEVNAQMNETEAVKLSQFAQLEAKERAVNQLKGMCKKLLGFIQSHREVYGDISNVNYEKLIADVTSSVELKFDLPESKFDHIFKPSRHVNFLVDVDAPIRNMLGQTGGTMPNYGQLIEELQLHVSSVINSNQSRAMRQSQSQPPSTDLRTEKQHSSIHVENKNETTFNSSVMQQSKDQQTRHHSKLSDSITTPGFKPTQHLVSQQSQQPVQHQQVKVYEDDRPLPTLAKAAAQAEAQQQFPPRRNQRSLTPKATSKVDTNFKVDQMRTTLAALKEEKTQLENKLKRNRNDTDTQFELDLVQKNIATLADKIAKA